MERLNQVRPLQLRALASALIAAREPFLVTGAPGVGKTDIITAAARDVGADIILSHPVVQDPTDAKGLPWVGKDGDTATFLPFGELAQAISATRPTVWFLDDLGQAAPAVQASYMQLLLARRINGHKLPECLTFAAATNRRQDRAAVSGILDPVKSRFAAILDLQPTLDDWCDWAVRANIPPEIVAFLRTRPNLLQEDPEKRSNQDIVNAPSPRTWAAAARLFRLGLPKSVATTAYAGAVGDGAALEFTSFLALLDDAPDIDAILANPLSAPVPGDDKPHALYAVATGLAYRCDTVTFAAIAAYCERLHLCGHGEFAALCLHDCLKRCFAIVDTEAYGKLCAGPVADLILSASRI